MQWDEIATKLAGVAGALVSTRFLSGTWPQKLATAASGAIASFFATPYVVAKLSLPEGFAGFLVGLFGMAILSRTWDWLQTSSLVSFLHAFFRTTPTEKTHPKRRAEDHEAT